MEDLGALQQFELQQYLPFTVLKLSIFYVPPPPAKCEVATVLTVYGIETRLRPPKPQPSR